MPENHFDQNEKYSNFENSGKNLQSLFLLSFLVRVYAYLASIKGILPQIGYKFSFAVES